MTHDIKTQRVVASLLHSRVMVSGAPGYVISAMQRWVEELDKTEGDIVNNKSQVSVFTENTNVSDSATLNLVNKEDKRN